VSRLYTYIPLDFDQALKDGRLRAFDYALGCHLACESFRALNTNRGIVTVHISTLADVFGCDRVTVRRGLRRLKEAGWIDFPEPDERQRAPWPIALTGLAREAQTRGTATPTATRVAVVCDRGRAGERPKAASRAGFRRSTTASLARARKRNETKRRKPLQ
jgi:hypothetical protein